jgi:glycosyltransferase involved in cell wall biosynthesis
MVLEKNPHHRFLIVGDGLERTYLEELLGSLGLEDTVRIIPEIPVSPQYYSACDLFVLPSLYEGFGIVFLEAMSAGLPIVSTTAPAIPEVVGGCGVLVPPKRPDLLASAILDVLGNNSLRAQLIKCGLDRSNAYSWEKLIRDYEIIYETARNA